MTEQQIQEKLAGMKKTRKLLSKVTLCVSILAIIVLVVYNFLGITFCKSPLPDQIMSAADFSKGFTFPGWQMVFWGCGGQFIMQDNFFNPNVVAIIAMVGTIIALIVCAALKKGKNKAKAIREFISAGCLAFSALVLCFFIVPVSKLAVTSGGVYHFKEFLETEGTVYQPTATAIILGVVLLLFAAFKVYNALFLLKQKKFAAQYAPKKKKGE